MFSSGTAPDGATRIKNRGGRPPTLTPSGLTGSRGLPALLALAARELGGVSRLASLLGIKYQSMYAWASRGWMPASEWTGMTRYAAEIERLTGSKVSKAQLLAYKPRPNNGRKGAEQ